MRLFSQIITLEKLIDKKFDIYRLFNDILVKI